MITQNCFFNVVASIRYGMGWGPQVDLFLNEKFYDLKEYYQEPILDFGAGSCFFTSFLKSQDLDVTPIDRFNASKFPDITPICYNGQQIPFPDNHFSTTLCHFVLHHIQEQNLLMSELMRVTSKYLIIGEDVIDFMTDRVIASIHGNTSSWTFDAPTFRSTEGWKKFFQHFSSQVVRVHEIPRWKIPYYPVKRVLFVVEKAPESKKIVQIA